MVFSLANGRFLGCLLFVGVFFLRPLRAFMPARIVQFAAAHHRAGVRPLALGVATLARTRWRIKAGRPCAKKEFVGMRQERQVIVRGASPFAADKGDDRGALQQTHARHVCVG